MTPASEMVEVVYGRTVTFDAASAADDYWWFSNGPVKPDFNNSHQPTGWQTVVANRYALARVFSYKYRISFLAQGAKPALVWTYESNEDPSGSTFTDQVGNPYFKHRSLTGNAGKGEVTMAGGRTLDKVLGAGAMTVRTSPDYEFNTTYVVGPPELGLPQDKTFLAIGVQILDGSLLSASPIQVTVAISYFVKCYNRILQ